jgi:hypothetical protein
MGIYELMVTTEEVRHLAHDNASTWEIKKAAVQRHGDVATDGWSKVVAGKTSGRRGDAGDQGRPGGHGHDRPSTMDGCCNRR